MHMVSIRKRDLKSLIRESYIGSILNEGRDLDQHIVALILSLKDLLLKRNFVCNTQYVSPNPNKRHRDFGYCSIKVDTTLGRGKSLSPRAISGMIARLCNKMGISKYFSVADHGYDGKYCDCGLRLKPKYVDKYMISQQL